MSFNFSTKKNKQANQNNSKKPTKKKAIFFVPFSFFCKLILLFFLHSLKLSKKQTQTRNNVSMPSLFCFSFFSLRKKCKALFPYLYTKRKKKKEKQKKKK